MGASIKGLSNPNSKLQLNEKIQKYSFENPDSILVFFLGQVDIEFGYYYKCVCDKIKYKIEDYINEIINTFEKYLLTSVKNKFIIWPRNSPIFIVYSLLYNIFNKQKNFLSITSNFSYIETIIGRKECALLGTLYNIDIIHLTNSIKKNITNYLICNNKV